jgi:hypothetical protein
VREVEDQQVQDACTQHRQPRSQGERERGRTHVALGGGANALVRRFAETLGEGDELVPRFLERGDRVGEDDLAVCGTKRKGGEKGKSVPGPCVVWFMGEGTYAVCSVVREEGGREDVVSGDARRGRGEAGGIVRTVDVVVEREDGARVCLGEVVVELVALCCGGACGVAGAGGRGLAHGIRIQHAKDVLEVPDGDGLAAVAGDFQDEVVVFAVCCVRGRMSRGGGEGRGGDARGRMNAGVTPAIFWNASAVGVVHQRLRWR